MWWLKADCVDVVAGLGESVHLEWSGDVHLNDGTLQANHEEYIQHLNFIAMIGLRGEKTKLESGLKEDLKFISYGTCFVCVCVCLSVCPSVTALAATASAYTCSQRYSGVCLWINVCIF